MFNHNLVGESLLMDDLFLRRRSFEAEWMDEFSIQDCRLTDALADLNVINRLLGGHSTSFCGLTPLLEDLAAGSTLHILDIGCGGGDFAAALLRWGAQRYPSIIISVTGIDISPATVNWAKNQIDSHLPPALAQRAAFVCGDALSLPYRSHTFTVAHASLFTHHLSTDDMVRLLMEMDRVATNGIIVNDLHRHLLACQSIKVLTKLFNASPMVQHDGPLSVRRGFTRDEIQRIVAAADMGDTSLTWRWAFRWLLSTVKANHV